MNSAVEKVALRRGQVRSNFRCTPLPWALKHAAEEGRMKYPAPPLWNNWNGRATPGWFLCQKVLALCLFSHLHYSKLEYSSTVFQLQDRLGCNLLKAEVYSRQYIWDEPIGAVIIEVKYPTDWLFHQPLQICHLDRHYRASSLCARFVRVWANPKIFTCAI